MRAEATWITPAQAERLVASYVDHGSAISAEAMFQISSWILQDQLSTLALEVTRWVDETAAEVAQARTAPSEPRVDVNASDADRPLPAYRVNAAYSPPSAESSAAIKIVITNYSLRLEDWVAIHSADVGESSMLATMWTASEITHALTGQRHPHARVTYAGLRMSREDIERCISIAGWAAPASRAAESTSAVAPSPPAMWSDEQMDAAIASCGYSNRDLAWREHFGPKQAEHAWKIQSFRDRWSKARGTEGMTGRPSKSA